MGVRRVERKTLFGRYRNLGAGKSQEPLIMTEKWTTDDIPRQDGKVMVVTGANSGLGLETTRILAARGAHVVLACRTAEKAEEAMREIRTHAPRASVEFMPLDLASLESVRAFAAGFQEQHTQLDVLCNNAGVMALPFRKTTEGFEMQIGTNHLGHFALTGLLLGALQQAEAPRVVTVSSLAHNFGKIRFNDLNWSRGYRKWPAYGQSKLANLLFAFELQRRLERSGQQLISVAVHPGYAATNLQAAGPIMENSTFGKSLMDVSNSLLAQPADMGALPSLYGCTSPHVEGGRFYGPGGFQQLRGHPVQVKCSRRARSEADASRLWTLSEDLTGVEYLS